MSTRGGTLGCSSSPSSTINMRYKGRIELGDSINFTAHDEATEKALYDSFKIKRICRIADEQEDKENNMLLESIYKNDAEKIASYIISKYNGASSRIDVTDAIKSILSASNEKYSRECLDNAVYSSNYNTKAVKSARRNVYLGINKEANINDLRDIWQEKSCLTVLYLYAQMVLFCCV